jgi:hypothetical protein
MTATNHTITGVLIGLTIPQPVIAVVVAVLSHFVLDALPHYSDPKLHGKKLIPILTLDASVALIVLGSMVVVQPQHWLLAIVCGIAAASPDLMWFPLWLCEVLGRPKKPLNAIQRFHSKIQWAEKPYNYHYEFIWFIASLFLLVKAV